MERREKVFIIESGNTLYKLLADYFEHQGFSVKALNGLAQAKKEIGKYPKSAILLDITDEDQQGYAILQTLKKDNSSIPIIILSHSDEMVEIDKALRLGAEDYIIKADCTPEEALVKIRRALLKSSGNEPSKDDHMDTQPLAPIDITSVKVLIVEDDQFLRDLSTRKLKQEGFKVEIAIDGNEGFKRIEELKPDVVLLDIILPGIDGFEILKRVRSHKNDTIRNSAVILLSNLGQESDVAKGERLGADDYLIKANFTIDEIIDKIRNVLGKKKIQGV